MSDHRAINSRQPRAAGRKTLHPLVRADRCRASAAACASAIALLARPLVWRRLLLAVAMLVAMGAPAAGASYTSSGPGNWDAPGTWGGAGVPVAGDAVSIGAHAIALNGADRACASVTFTGSGSITGANTLTLTGSIDATGSAAPTISCSTLAWGSSLAAIGNASIGTLTISAAITGTAGLTKTGSGVVDLGATDTYSGATTVSAGTLQVNGSITSAAIPDDNVVTLANVAGAVLDLNNTSETIGGLAGGGATGGNVTLGTGTLTLAGDTATTYSGAISGGVGGTLVRGGNGSLTLAGTNSFANATIGSGVLSVTGGSAIADTATVTMTSSDAVWIEDAAPFGATVGSDGSDSWTWVGASPAPFSGTLAHQSAIAGPGSEHQHYFFGATTPLPVATGDTLVQYVYLDPVNPPTEVMVQFDTGPVSFDHRAYWGANAIPWGVDGTNTRRYLGALPATGVWVRLEIPASQVGLEGFSVSGVAYTLVDGRATWDYTAKLGGGRFDVAASETIGSLASAIAMSTVSLTAGTLTIAGSASTTYAGTTTGAGTLNMAGSGVLTLSGTAAHTGATTVSAGELFCSGSYATSTASLVGGILGGTGTYGAIAAAVGCVDGVIRPGSSASIGTLRGGTTDLSLGTRPTVKVRIAAYAAAGTSYDGLDLATAGGTLTLGGDSLLILDLSGLATPGTATGVITYSGTCTGTFSTVQLLNNPNGWMAQVDYSQTGHLDVVICKRRRGGSGTGYPPSF